MLSTKISVNNSQTLGAKVYTLLAELLANQEGAEIVSCNISPVNTPDEDRVREVA